MKSKSADKIDYVQCKRADIAGTSIFIDEHGGFFALLEFAKSLDGEMTYMSARLPVRGRGGIDTVNPGACLTRSAGSLGVAGVAAGIGTTVYPRLTGQVGCEER